MAQKMVPWKRIKIEPAVMRALTSRSNAKGFLHVLPYLIITITLGILSFKAFKTQPLWVSIPVFYVYATVYSFSGYTAAIHELSHNTVFKTKWLNELFIIIFSFMSWSDYVFFRASHTQHHAFTTHHDKDEEVILPIKLTPWMFIQKFTIDFTRFTSKDELLSYRDMFRRALGIIKPGREAKLFEGKEGKIKKLIRWNRALILSHLCVIIIAIITKEWLLLLLITFGIQFGQGLNMMVSLSQHTCMEPDINDFRRNCRSMTLGPINSFLYWRMEHHIEHHMFGGVPFYNLEKLTAIIGDQLPPRTGLIGSWKEIQASYKIQKKDPTYYKPLDLPTIE